MKINEGRATFFKKLKPSQKIGGGAKNWMTRRGERERASKHEHLDESRGVPMLQSGGCTQQVSNDTAGRVGVAKLTLRNAADGAYVLKGFKEDEKICRYMGIFSRRGLKLTRPASPRNMCWNIMVLR